MSTSATSSQLGRQFWAAIRDSANNLASKLPGRQPPLSGLGLSHAPWKTHNANSTRWFSRAYQPRISANNVRKSCTSGGLLLIGLSSGPSSTSTVMTTCSAVADSALSGNAVQRAKLSYLARQAWIVGLRRTSTGGIQAAGKRASSSNVGGGNNDNGKLPTPSKNSGETHTEEKPSPANNPSLPDQPGQTTELHPSELESLANSMSKYLHLPKMPHRPTKQELLDAANGFWERQKVRFKWFSIRSMRPWNADEWGAFVSWFLFGHLVWILVGTTTFFSLVILTINTVFAQGRSYL